MDIRLTAPSSVGVISNVIHSACYLPEVENALINNHGLVTCKLRMKRAQEILAAAVELWFNVMT
ncbi:unnamed protein product [Dovyalis caffra]|uniref:Uncharacterized protein n=1 Tax=Dovyalis caffra TaxID=77055 RepID=A0AAV1RAN6_9ROSI|nr:unnamed protein product [Dovyalis caffra]